MKNLLAALPPTLVIAAAFVPTGDTPSALAARTAAPLIVGLGLVPASFFGSRASGALSFATIVVAACAGTALAMRSAGAGADRTTALVWVLLTFVVLLALVLPLLAAGARASAACGWLFLAAAACGSLALARGAGGAIPTPFLELNPLVRVFRHGLDYDWLHAANVYPHVGTLYYRYPERSDGIPQIAGLAGAGAVVAAVVSRIRRSRDRAP